MAATLPARRVAAPRPDRTPASSRRQQAPRKKSAPTAKSDAGRARTERPARAARPELRLVAKPRVAINAALVLVGVIVSLMLSAVVLHTRLAERQLEIDRLEGAVTEARERFDVLRQQRAELRSPTRLSLASSEFGMQVVPQTRFLTVDAATLAEVLAGAGAMEDRFGSVDAGDPIDQIRRVKVAAEGEP